MDGDTRHPADLETERQISQRKLEEAQRQMQKSGRFLGDTAGAPTSFPE